MREIKFRGKLETSTFNKGAGAWVYGSLEVPRSEEGTEPWAVIIAYSKGNDSRSTYCVDPKTVGQYTGLKDAEGREIYEGDILRHVDDDGCGQWCEYRIELRKGAFIANTPDSYEDLGDMCANPYYVVVGNVHDERPRKIGGPKE